MSVVPHTRAHIVNPRYYTDEVEVLTQEPLSCIQMPVQIAADRHGQADATQFTYHKGVYDLNALVAWYNAGGRTDPLTQGPFRSLDDIDPVLWKGRPNNAANGRYVTNTIARLAEVRAAHQAALIAAQQAAVAQSIRPMGGVPPGAPPPTRFVRRPRLNNRPRLDVDPRLQALRMELMELNHIENEAAYAAFRARRIELAQAQRSIPRDPSIRDDMWQRLDAFYDDEQARINQQRE